MVSNLASSAFVLLATFVAMATSTAVFGNGECPVVNTQSSFNRQQYLGKWYEYERFGNWFEIGVVCGTADYGDNPDGSVSVINAGQREFSIFGRTIYSEPTYIEGSATVPNATRPAELRVSFSEYDQGGTDPNYFIVETDYVNYAVVFSCSELPIVPYNIQFAWILTRQAGVAPANIASIKSNLQSYGIDTDKLFNVRQTDCPSNSNTVA